MGLAVGVLGGFTTFSTFTIDPIYRWERGEATMAIVTVLVSVVVGLAAAVVGLAISRSLSP